MKYRTFDISYETLHWCGYRIGSFDLSKYRNFDVSYRSLYRCWISYRTFRHIELSNLRCIVSNSPLVLDIVNFRYIELQKFRYIVSNSELMLGYRIESFDTSKYRNFKIYRIERVLVLYPLHPRVFMQMMNESFDVSNIKIVNIGIVKYRCSFFVSWVSHLTRVSFDIQHQPLLLRLSRRSLRVKHPTS